jgi:hypothetical protein
LLPVRQARKKSEKCASLRVGSAFFMNIVFMTTCYVMQKYQKQAEIFLYKIL